MPSHKITPTAMVLVSSSKPNLPALIGGSAHNRGCVLVADTRAACALMMFLAVGSARRHLAFGGAHKDIYRDLSGLLKAQA